MSGLFDLIRFYYFSALRKTSIRPTVLSAIINYLSLALSGSVRLQNQWSPPPPPSLPIHTLTHSAPWVKNEEDEEERGVFELSLPCLVPQPFILIPVDTCYFFDGKYKALLGNIRRAPLIPAAQIQISFSLKVQFSRPRPFAVTSAGIRWDKTDSLAGG